MEMPVKKNKIKRVKYFTDAKKELISQDNLDLYEKYYRSCTITNRDTKSTTYKVYKNYMTHFLVYLAEVYDNIGLYELCELDRMDILELMEGFIGFLQDVLYNNKKVINTKLSAISSFYIWSEKRGLIKSHPFAGKLDRMQNAKAEKIIESYFLTDQEINTINLTMIRNPDKYDIQDRILFNLALDSANRIGAIEKITLSSLDLDECIFKDIREKRGKIVDVVFSEKTKKMIEQWIEIRKTDFDKLECDALFITKYNGQYNKMGRTTMHKKARKFGYILDIDDFHMHCLRKTSINQIASVSLELASSMANHESLDVTKNHYVKPKSKQEIKQKIAQLMEQKNKK